MRTSYVNVLGAPHSPGSLCDAVGETAGDAVKQPFIVPGLDILKLAPDLRTAEQTAALELWLDSLPIFRNLPEEVAAYSARHAVYREVKAGEVVLKQEHVLDEWSVLLSGKARVEAAPEDLPDEARRAAPRRPYRSALDLDELRPVASPALLDPGREEADDELGEGLRSVSRQDSVRSLGSAGAGVGAGQRGAAGAAGRPLRCTSWSASRPSTRPATPDPPTPPCPEEEERLSASSFAEVSLERAQAKVAQGHRGEGGVRPATSAPAPLPPPDPPLAPPHHSPHTPSNPPRPSPSIRSVSLSQAPPGRKADTRGPTLDTSNRVLHNSENVDQAHRASDQSAAAKEKPVPLEESPEGGEGGARGKGKRSKEGGAAAPVYQHVIRAQTALELLVTPRPSPLQAHLGGAALPSLTMQVTELQRLADLCARDKGVQWTRHDVRRTAGLLRDWFAVFDHLPLPVVEQLAATMTVEAVPKGNIICMRGDLTKSMFFVASGAAGVHEAVQGQGERAAVEREAAVWQAGPCGSARSQAAALDLMRLVKKATDLAKDAQDPRSRGGRREARGGEGRREARASRVSGAGGRVGEEGAREAEPAVQRSASFRHAASRVLPARVHRSRRLLSVMGNKATELRATLSAAPVQAIMVGQGFGQPALLTGAPTPFTVTALHDSEVVMVNQAELDRILSWWYARKSIAKLLQRSVLRESEVDHLVYLTKDIKFLTTLDAGMRREICRTSKYRRIWADEVLFHKHDVGDAFYIVLSGTLAIHDPEAREKDLPEAKLEELRAQGIHVGHGRFLRLLGSGDSFGELALIAGEHGERAATVVAATDCELMCVMKDDFELVNRVLMASQTTMKIHYLQSLSILHKVPVAKLGVFACQMEPVCLPSHHCVVHQGRPASHVYFMTKGQVKLVHAADALKPPAAPAARLALAGAAAAAGEAPRGAGPWPSGGAPRGASAVLALKLALPAKPAPKAMGSKPSPGPDEAPPEVSHSNVEIAVLGPGEIFGDFAALSGGEQPLTVETMSVVEAYMIPGEDFVHTLQKLKMWDEMYATSKMRHTWHMKQVSHTWRVRASTMSGLSSARPEAPTPVLLHGKAGALQPPPVPSPALASPPLSDSKSPPSKPSMSMSKYLTPDRAGSRSMSAFSWSAVHAEAEAEAVPCSGGSRKLLLGLEPGGMRQHTTHTHTYTITEAGLLKTKNIHSQSALRALSGRAEGRAEAATEASHELLPSTKSMPTLGAYAGPGLGPGVGVRARALPRGSLASPASVGTGGRDRGSEGAAGRARGGFRAARRSAQAAAAAPSLAPLASLGHIHLADIPTPRFHSSEAGTGPARRGASPSSGGRLPPAPSTSLPSEQAEVHHLSPRDTVGHQGSDLLRSAPRAQGSGARAAGAGSSKVPGRGGHGAHPVFQAQQAGRAAQGGSEGAEAAQGSEPRLSPALSVDQRLRPLGLASATDTTKAQPPPKRLTDRIGTWGEPAGCTPVPAAPTAGPAAPTGAPPPLSPQRSYTHLLTSHLSAPKPPKPPRQERGVGAHVASTSPTQQGRMAKAAGGRAGVEGGGREGGGARRAGGEGPGRSAGAPPSISVHGENQARMQPEGNSSPTSPPTSPAAKGGAGAGGGHGRRGARSSPTSPQLRMGRASSPEKKPSALSSTVNSRLSESGFQALGTKVALQFA